MTIDWGALRALAEVAAARAHAPYSRFRVGAAGLVDDGRLVSGCNVENASYGLTLCAECGLVSDLHRSGGGRLVAVVCVGGEDDLTRVLPCGRCRQLLLESGDASTSIASPDGPLPLGDLLPHPFGPDVLPAP